MAWSDLPADLLRCVSSHLTVVDYLRLTAVCTSWNSALALNGGRPHFLRTRCRPSPWLLFPGDVEVASHRINFWDPTVEKGSGGFHRRVPSLSRHIFDRRCIGSKDGWLVTLGKRDLHPRLFNPLTTSEIPLPCLYSNILENHREEIKREYAPDGSVEYFTDRNFEFYAPGGKVYLDYYFHKIVLSSKDPSGTAVVIYGACRQLALARPEDQSWILLLDLPQHQAEWTMGFVDVCYHEEEQRFYAITYFSAVVSFDVNGQNVTCIRSSLKQRHWCQYIAILSGTLLRIVRNTCRVEHTGGDFIRKTDNIIVFKLDLLCTRVFLGSIRSSPKWILVSDLGGHSLFIGCNQTFSLHHTRVPGIKPNCIYFSEYRWHLTVKMHDILDAGLFDLHNRSIKYFLHSDAYPKFPPSIWFTPSLS